MIKLGIYRHNRGNLYQVLGCARHSEDYKEYVVYQQLYGDFGLWIRPLEMFKSSVTIKGETVPRFTFITEALSTPPSYEEK